MTPSLRTSVYSFIDQVNPLPEPSVRGDFTPHYIFLNDQTAKMTFLGKSTNAARFSVFGKDEAKSVNSVK